MSKSVEYLGVKRVIAIPMTKRQFATHNNRELAENEIWEIV